MTDITSQAQTTQTTQTEPTRRTPRPPLNGVDVPTLFATLDAVRETPSLAQFTWRASNRWVKGTHSQTRMETFHGAGGEHTHVRDFRYDADHPAVLVGADAGPTPVEFVLHALAACLTAGIANIAAARGIELTSIESTLEGQMDLRGILGLSGEVRNGYQGIVVRFHLEGDAPPETLRALVAQSKARSAVFDVLTNPVSIEIEVD